MLASVALVSASGVRAKARDARRLSDARQITTALHLYFVKNEKFPGSTASYGESETVNACGGWDTSTVDNDSDGRSFIEPLIDDAIISVVPADPIGTGLCGGYTYRYYRYGAGSYGCDAARGAFFVFGINDMETSARPYPSSPGWNCPTRNWQTEFDWVVGGFEK